MYKIFILLFLLAATSYAESDFSDLIKLAKKYELPIPDESAQLSLISTGYTSVLGNSSTSHDPGIYTAGFLLKKLPKNKQLVLIGYTQETLTQNDSHIPPTRIFALQKPIPELKGYVADFGNVSSFITAIQLACLGKEDMAKSLLEAIKKASFFSGPNAQERLTLKNRDILLAHGIYQYYYHLTLSGKDLKKSYQHLLELKEEFPSLFSKEDKDYFAYKKFKFIESLGLSVNAKEPIKGSVEYYLIKWSNKGKKGCACDYFSEHGYEHDQPLRELFLLGKKAVSQLKALNKDQRLTAIINPAIMNSPESRVRLGELAIRILGEMSGDQTELDESNTDEKSYFEAAAGMTDVSLTKLKDVPLWILGQKHPNSLLKITNRVIKKKQNELPVFGLCDVIRTSKLDKNAKVKALIDLANNIKDKRHRSILQNLAKTDELACSDFIKEALSKLNYEGTGPYWTCPEASYSHVIMQLQDPKIWSLYLQFAKKAVVGLRLEMMNSFNYTYINDKNQNLRIALLAEFLDDKTVRDQGINGGKYSGPCAAFTFEKIEVRNFVAMKIASIIDFKDRPNEFWTDKQWSELRTKVKEKVIKLNLPSL